MEVNIYILFWVCIFGLCLGSFYNVVILRTLSNESIVFPPSKCPKCGHKLYWWHNIPILSYLLLRAKCYFCGEKISIQYPLIEFLTMVLFGFAFIKFGISILTLFSFIWISCLIIMTGTDIKEKVVDCKISIVMAISALIFWTINSGLKGFIFSIFGMLLGALVVEIFARTGYLIAGTRAMGEGDTYVAGALGAMSGFVGILLVLLYSLAAAMLFIVPTFLINKFKSGDKLTCILSVLFIISAVILQRFPQNLFIIALIIIFGIMLAYSILKGIKQEKNRSYFPYVPALAIGALYFLFI